MVNETATRSLPPEAIAFAAQFFNAARKGDSNDRFDEALSAGLPANMQNDSGDTFLMLASYHGHAPLVRLLLSHGADPNVLNDRGQSCLAGAVYKDEREVVEALVEGGADPDKGQPSAWASMELFKNEKYRELFERARRRRDGEQER